MSIDRRRFLKSSAAGAALAGLGVSSCAHPGASGVRAGSTPFQHGVASGDPLADRVILWTRVSPEEGRPGEPIATRWYVARDAAGRERVASGEVDAVAERDYTVKIDAMGLAPATSYFYFFESGGFRSEVGRTRTLPDESDETFAQLRIGIVSCSNYPQGFFNAYGCLAERDDLDLVVHVGDYLYEYGNGEYGDGTEIGRVPDPLHEIVTLEDYRRRHANYKTDPDLQAAHARHPWITGWDDHETANNSWRDGAQNHSESEGDWSARKLAAVRAYTEWMPIREIPTQHFRSFRFGKLMDLVMLDTRLEGRDEQVASGDHVAARDPGRSMLGTKQTNWLTSQLSDSKARKTAWRVVGQQVIFAAMTDGDRDFNPDGWDGYRENRRQILDHLKSEEIDNVVFLTGDVHSAWALDVPPPLESGEAYDSETGEGSRAVEFVCPAVSSPPLGRSQRAREMLADPNYLRPQVRFLDIENNGFIVLDLTPSRVRAEFIQTESVKRRSREWKSGAIMEAATHSNHLLRVKPDACEGSGESSECDS